MRDRGVTRDDCGELRIRAGRGRPTRDGASDGLSDLRCRGAGVAWRATFMSSADPQHARFRRLMEAMPDIISELDLESLLQRVLATACELTGARYAALGVLDEDRQSSSGSSRGGSMTRPVPRSATSLAVEASSAS